MNASDTLPIPGPADGRLDQATDADLLCRLLELPAGSEGRRGTAQWLLEHHGGLRGLFRDALRGTRACGGLESHCLERLAVATELCRRRLHGRLATGPALTSPSAALEYLQHCLVDHGHEVFMALFLDTRHRALAVEELFRGSIDGACVYPRVVAERALRLGAAAVIVAHNHPSGVAEPSLADRAITQRLKAALALLEVRLLDHFVIGDGAPVSLADRGML